MCGMKFLLLCVLPLLYTTIEARRLGSWSSCESGQTLRTRRCSGNCRGVSLKQNCVIDGVWGAWQPCNSGQYETYRTCHMTQYDELHLDIDDDRPIKCGGQEFQTKLCRGARAADVKPTGTWGRWGAWSSCRGETKMSKSRSRVCTGANKCDGLAYEESNDCPANQAARSGDVSIGYNYKDDFCGREDKYWATLSTGSGILFSHGSYGDQSPAVPASPWSQLYENNMMTCNYLKVDECQKITFSFGNDTVFEIEEEQHPSGHCPYDWLEIHDQNGDKLVDRTCGDTAPADFSSSTNKVVVIFRTDHNVRKQGFRIDWVATGGCNWSGWSDEGCDESTGFRNYTRTCTKEPVDCDCSCPGDDTKHEVCEVPCGYGDWTQWSECDDNGDQTRHRYGNNPVGRPDKGECPTEDDHRNVKVDGQWTDWTEWGMCASEGMHICTQGRERFCAEPCPSCGGDECLPPHNQTQSCNPGGEWSDWASWSGCGSGDGGSETRSRTCVNPCGFDDCEGPSTEERCCPLDCDWGEWSEAGECDKMSGTQRWSREMTQEPECDGAQCQGSCFDLRNCTVDCEWGDWFAFSPCDHVTKKQMWIRHESVTAKNGGSPCLCDDEDCDAILRPCPNATCTKCGYEVDGGWGDWSGWSCCRFGEMTRERACDSPAATCGGQSCRGKATDIETCGCLDSVEDKCDIGNDPYTTCTYMSTETGECLPGCSVNSQCPSNYACINRLCEPKAGFVLVNKIVVTGAGVGNYSLQLFGTELQVPPAECNTNSLTGSGTFTGDALLGKADHLGCNGAPLNGDVSGGKLIGGGTGWNGAKICIDWDNDGYRTHTCVVTNGELACSANDSTECV